MHNCRPWSISAFFPCYNDAGTIDVIVRETLDVLAELCSDFEVIVVENGSTDGTGAVLDGLEARYGVGGDDPRFAGRVRILRFGAPLGYGGALREGFAAASKDLIFYTDGDAQYDVRELPSLLARLEPGIDVVMGNKRSRADGLHRLIIGRLYHSSVKLLFGLRVRDTDCDFRLIRREALAHIRLEKTSGAAPLELVKRLQDAGAVFAEVPVSHYARVYGRSQFFRLPRILEVATDVADLWWKLVVRRERTSPGAVVSARSAATRTEGAAAQGAAQGAPAQGAAQGPSPQRAVG